MTYVLGRNPGGNEYVQSGDVVVSTSISVADRRVMLLSANNVEQDIFVILRGWQSSNNWLRADQPFYDSVNIFNHNDSGYPLFSNVERGKDQVLWFSSESQDNPHNINCPAFQVPQELERPLLHMMLNLGAEIPVVRALQLENNSPVRSLSSVLLNPR